jgi:phosphomevalonate kinase
VNPFVEKALLYSLRYALTRVKQAIKLIDITILFDQGFLSSPSKGDSSKFISYGEGSTKTGLGSSACVTVAIVGGALR